LHSSTHWGTQAICDHLLRTYVCSGAFEIARAITENCMTCLKVNKKVMRKAPLGGRKLARRPFQSIQIDFTELPQIRNYKYLLVIFDRLTHWVEAVLTARATAEAVSKTLLEQIIPRYGIVNTIDSDKGPHFTSKVLQQLVTALGIHWKFHTPWHSQSSGQVERMNQTLKNVLTKLMMETKINWLKCLPLALLRIRTKPRTDIGIYPYEAMFGLPFLTPNALATYEEGEQYTKKYVKEISKNLEQLRKKGFLPQTAPLDFKIRPFTPADWVLIKSWKD
ncbi:TF211 protein, partial [Dasyornis broadbenti]|nr:TF211 protein [Dasyornis broadbenti]